MEKVTALESEFYISLIDGSLVQPTSSSMILMCEHIVQDRSIHFKDNQIKFEEINLQNLQIILSQPE